MSLTHGGRAPQTGNLTWSCRQVPKAAAAAEWALPVTLPVQSRNFQVCGSAIRNVLWADREHFATEGRSGRGADRPQFLQGGQRPHPHPHEGAGPGPSLPSPAAFGLPLPQGRSKRPERVGAPGLQSTEASDSGAAGVPLRAPKRGAVPSGVCGGAGSLLAQPLQVPT